MRLGRFLLSIFSPKILGEEIVKKQEDMYEHHVSMYPDLDPHQHLAAVWLSRMTVSGHDPNTELLKEAAFTETMQFACVPPPQCARALGLYIVYREEHRIIEKYRVFQEEFETLMQPVFEANENGTMYDLYQKYNPKMAERT